MFQVYKGSLLFYKEKFAGIVINEKNVYNQTVYKNVKGIRFEAAVDEWDEVKPMLANIYTCVRGLFPMVS